MQLLSSTPDGRSCVTLTQRETQILFLMAQEQCSSEIAESLHIKETTVRSHRKNLYIKLDVSKSAGAVRKGFEIGYLRFA